MRYQNNVSIGDKTGTLATDEKGRQQLLDRLGHNLMCETTRIHDSTVTVSYFVDGQPSEVLAQSLDRDFWWNIKTPSPQQIDQVLKEVGAYGSRFSHVTNCADQETFRQYLLTFCPTLSGLAEFTFGNGLAKEARDCNLWKLACVIDRIPGHEEFITGWQAIHDGWGFRLWNPQTDECCRLSDGWESLEWVN